MKKYLLIVAVVFGCIESNGMENSCCNRNNMGSDKGACEDFVENTSSFRDIDFLKDSFQKAVSSKNSTIATSAFASERISRDTACDALEEIVSDNSYWNFDTTKFNGDSVFADAAIEKILKVVREKPYYSDFGTYSEDCKIIIDNTSDDDYVRNRNQGFYCIESSGDNKEVRATQNSTIPIYYEISSLEDSF